MQILLIRHGESEDDFLDEGYVGSTDLPLTEKGVLQVQKMAKRVLYEFPPELIWSSTLKRAKQAAEMLSHSTRCPVEYLDDLIEMQNTEDRLAFRKRGQEVLSFIKLKSGDFSRIAIVTHGGMITQIVESFLELPTENNIWFHTDYTGIHLLDYYQDKRIIRFSNSTSHLQGL
ncbi:2,3-bisphosphoglycerate-dependent phosphoglycerate mutase [Fictibacillus solisalsi]|uniref:2,3-bisphosphoglycerate-dependent phosphoglycerate mutase n=1 Tax=Fictibacillus solisalsi TaxID=459525 RepID=A0A1G9ZUT8_9BACL|nr:histidine phosphatase family protein [Fictibacillus solisalsi]SDN24944.1 2,3-bisphosphoglycerate-dependent phosphoglycerate mutase [Fictibacillus solisalsi]